MDQSNENAVNDLIAHWDDDERSRDVHMERYWKKQIAEAALTRLRNGERGAELFRGVKADLGSPDIGVSPAIFFLIVKVLVLLAELWFQRRSNET